MDRKAHVSKQGKHRASRYKGADQSKGRPALTPDVITILWKRENTGFMAMEASKHAKWRIGLAMVGARSSKGSMMMVKPGRAERQVKVKESWNLEGHFVLGYEKQGNINTLCTVGDTMIKTENWSYGLSKKLTQLS